MFKSRLARGLLSWRQPDLAAEPSRRRRGARTRAEAAAAPVPGACGATATKTRREAEELSQILLANASGPRVPGEQSFGRLPDAVRPKRQKLVRNNKVAVSCSKTGGAGLPSAGVKPSSAALGRPESDRAAAENCTNKPQNSGQRKKRSRGDRGCPKHHWCGRQPATSDHVGHEEPPQGVADD